VRPVAGPWQRNQAWMEEATLGRIGLMVVRGRKPCAYNKTTCIRYQIVNQVLINSFSTDRMRLTLTTDQRETSSP
jgi:hypothetical protein